MAMAVQMDQISPKIYIYIKIINPETPIVNLGIRDTNHLAQSENQEILPPPIINHQNIATPSAKS